MLRRSKKGVGNPRPSAVYNRRQGACQKGSTLARIPAGPLVLVTAPARRQLTRTPEKVVAFAPGCLLRVLLSAKSCLNAAQDTEASGTTHCRCDLRRGWDRQVAASHADGSRRRRQENGPAHLPAQATLRRLHLSSDAIQGRIDFIHKYLPENRGLLRADMPQGLRQGISIEGELLTLCFAQLHEIANRNVKRHY